MRTPFTMHRLTVVLLLAIAVSCGSTDDPASPPAAPGIPAGAVLGIHPVTATLPPPPQEGLDALNAVFDAGARGHVVSLRWSDIEPQPGQYDLTELQSNMQLLPFLGFTRLLVNIQTINTTRREVPADLVNVTWDAPEMQARIRALLDQVLPLLDASTAYLSIGNEVDVYLGATDEWAAYGTFFTQARQYVRASRPNLEVGIATTFDGARGPWHTEVQTLNALADVAIWTYYGNDGGFQALPPSAGPQALREMVMLAAGKPVVVQELGQASTPVNGGSDARQAQFLMASLEEWNKIGGNAMPFLSVFALHDFPGWLCDDLVTYYGVGSSVAFREFLCTLGLRRQDGSLKPSWDSVRAFGRR